MRKRSLDPPASARVYELTERGARLEPVILELGRFGSVAPFPDGDATFGPDALALALKTLYEPGGAGAQRRAAARRPGLPRERRRRRAHARARHGRRARRAIEAEPGPLAAVLWHGRALADAERAGEVAITGSRRTATRFLRRFPLLGLASAPRRGRGVGHGRELVRRFAAVTRAISAGMISPARSRRSKVWVASSTKRTS